jgi:hypothetical protein
MLHLPRVRALGTIALRSPGFSHMRAHGSALVDKTGAIADLLAFMDKRRHVFFARPGKFGKHTTLGIASEMLAAGTLPSGVVPWPGYTPVDTEALFGGLQVHERLLRKDASLGGLLQRPHFVVHLSLASAMTGAFLENSIIDQIMFIMERAFGEEHVTRKVRQYDSPMGALTALVNKVPPAVPVALLVEDCDAVIRYDVDDAHWDAANKGVKALRSLAMTTKSPSIGSRIERSIFTGVARFAHASLSNNFVDLTGHPLVSCVLGFSEAEIRATFPTELQRLAEKESTDVDGAVRKLAHWYKGYCFDGVSTCFNPYPVLCTLDEGEIAVREMAAARKVNWLGLSPRELSEELVRELVGRGAPVDNSLADIADLQSQHIRAIPLLLQIGLLSLHTGQKTTQGQQLQYHPPNEYARRSLQVMAKNALSVSRSVLSSMNSSMVACDHGAFSAAAQLVLTQIPITLFKLSTSNNPQKLCKDEDFYGRLITAIFCTAPLGVCIIPQAASQVGLADIVVDFRGAQREVIWMIDLGEEGTAADKLAQVVLHAAAYGPSVEVLCCAMVVIKRKPASMSVNGRRGEESWRKEEGLDEDEEHIIDVAWAKRTVSSGGQVGWDKMEGEKAEGGEGGSGVKASG